MAYITMAVKLYVAILWTISKENKYYKFNCKKPFVAKHLDVKDVKCESYFNTFNW